MKTTSQIANEILDALLRISTAYEVRRATNKGYAECRDWGVWENPVDMPDDEDENDYDWQVLTPTWKDHLYTISKKFIDENPECKIRISAEEKNWIVIIVETIE